MLRYQNTINSNMKSGNIENQRAQGSAAAAYSAPHFACLWFGDRDIRWLGMVRCSSLIEKLELLLALAKERHFGRAAEACGVTQPTMSTSLKQLEEILGVMLVQRDSRFQGFTPEGERTLDWARRIVGDARAMRKEIKSLKDKLSGEIKIAAIATSPPCWAWSHR
jgi:hypothetical protein